MFPRTRRALPAASFLVLVAACSGEAPQVPAVSSGASGSDARARKRKAATVCSGHGRVARPWPSVAQR